MNYQACLDYLHKNCRRGTPGGYGRTVRMAELLGNPQEQLRIIHIAGTNGKGSTAALVESMLRQGGYQVGLFTSPHLERYEERIQINRQLIAPEDFAAIFTRLVEQVIPVLLAEGMGHPGEFELLTVASWLYFQQRTDFVISEVGLGGTLDPTNIIQHPVLSIITPVSLDHCQILGDTVGQIAREKAGILKAGVPAVIAPQQPEALASIEAMAVSYTHLDVYKRQNVYCGTTLPIPQLIGHSLACLSRIGLRPARLDNLCDDPLQFGIYGKGSSDACVA